MPSTKTKNARAAAKAAAEKARAEVKNARERAEETRASEHFTAEGVEEYVGAWVKSARTTATAELEGASTRTGEAREAAEGKLLAARTIPATQRATTTAILGPVLAAAANDPSVLVRAYEKRAPQSLADRVILEDAIGVVLDAGMGGVGFAEDWNRTRTALGESVATPAEIEAAADLAAIERLEGYISAATTLTDSELVALERGEDLAFGIAVENARHVVATFERDLDAGTIDNAATVNVRDGAAILQESTERPGNATKLPPQEVAAAVWAETMARKAAGETAEAAETGDSGD